MKDRLFSVDISVKQKHLLLETKLFDEIKFLNSKITYLFFKNLSKEPNVKYYIALRGGCPDSSMQCLLCKLNETTNSVERILFDEIFDNIQNPEDLLFHLDILLELQ